MIIFKDTKGFQSRTDKPNENWTDNINVFVVEDGSELASKILQDYPYFDFVLNENGELVDAISTEKPPEPPEPPTIEDRIRALEETTNFLLGL